ncbi:cytochrome b/b6 domain-containing protein [Teredinibacter turnerae]|uniref:cytochrome b/b6 domain-containing protein n=1 Tax=Teredinibacter turnerae TaxID=2426 RepID=UPI000400856E|nr:cytochrome b/b6 domain-containing protein [Teredinibacter turnerae]
MQKAKAEAKVSVWDLPLRLCHWGLVASIAVCWWSAENHNMVWHVNAGYTALGVVIFRIYWGFFGGTHARFAHFLKGPAAVLAYSKKFHHRESTAGPGHNPLGALSAIALLLCALLQAGLGLFAIDVDGYEGGPYADYLDFDTARAFAQWHEWNFNLLFALIALHLAAIVYYQVWKKQPLARAMITGKKALSVEHAVAESAESKSVLVPALIGLILSVGIVLLIRS